MNTTDLDYSDEDAPEGSFFKRNWLALIVGTAVLAGGTTAAIALSNKGGSGSRKAENMTMVTITPPPPVMLPPPPPPPQQELEEIKPEEEQEEALPEDSGPSTNNVGGAPDAFKLPPGKGKRGPVVIRAVSPRALWTKYANSATSRIADAMRRHNKFKHSTLSVIARVWIDSTGRITKADIDSTGDAGLDAALRNDILNGMQLSGPPPEGMLAVMPVKLKLNARRPG